MLREIIEGLDYTFIEVNVESEEKILKLFQSDIEYEPTSAEEFLYLGVYHRKDSEKALVYYQQAGELGNSIGYHNMAFLYVKRKDFDKAKFYYEKAGELGHSKSIYDLADLCAQTGDFEKAKIYYEKAFLLTHKYVSVLGHERLMAALSRLTYPISEQNKDQIYVVLETFDMPKDLYINSNLFCIMQDVVARKVKIMCDIAFYYKKYNK